jgi:hypothetical protein
MIGLMVAQRQAQVKRAKSPAKAAAPAPSRPAARSTRWV